MTRICISEYVDDRNDGLTREIAAVKLCDGNKEMHLMQGDTTLHKLAQK
jgi:hypothetical protein